MEERLAVLETQNKQTMQDIREIKDSIKDFIKENNSSHEKISNALMQFADVMNGKIDRLEKKFASKRVERVVK
jgi:regulator of replication initiation timing